MLAPSSLEFFVSLDAQAAEGLIVEDEDTLLPLARLVPILFDLIERTAPASDVLAMKERVDLVVQQAMEE